MVSVCQSVGRSGRKRREIIESWPSALPQAQHTERIFCEDAARPEASPLERRKAILYALVDGLKLMLLSSVRLVAPCVRASSLLTGPPEGKLQRLEEYLLAFPSVSNSWFEADKKGHRITKLQSLPDPTSES